MTPAARLRAQAHELLRIADELDAVPTHDERLALPAPAPARLGEGPSMQEDLGRIIGVSAAASVTGLSESSLYRAARRFRVGWRLPGGSWAFSTTRLRRFMRADMPDGGFGKIGGIGKVETIDPSPSPPHHLDDER